MFTPRYLKHSKLLLRHAQKYLRYKRDVLDDATGRRDFRRHAAIAGGHAHSAIANKLRPGPRSSMPSYTS